MTTDAGKISRTIALRRRALLEAYDDEDLHQFRIHIRRARALLKQYPAHKSKRVRREWAEIATRTNAARDWDTLALYANKTLPEKAWQAVRPRIEQERDAARQQVIKTLRSPDWDRTWKHWLQWTKHLDGERTTPPAPEHDAGDMLVAARECAGHALAAQDDQSWHRFRIAIKNLRYSLDTPLAKSTWDKAERKALKRLCKQLQRVLGDWHDTVVHRALIQSLADQLTADNPGDEVAGFRSLLSGIESTRRECLGRALSLAQSFN